MCRLIEVVTVRLIERNRTNGLTKPCLMCRKRHKKRIQFLCNAEDGTSKKVSLGFSIPGERALVEEINTERFEKGKSPLVYSEIYPTCWRRIFGSDSLQVQSAGKVTKRDFGLLCVSCGCEVQDGAWVADTPIREDKLSKNAVCEECLLEYLNEDIR